MAEKAWTKRLAGPLLLFAILVVAKWLLVMGDTVGPVVFKDEALYARFALSLFRLRFYGDTQYPPLYPMLLSPAYAFGDRFYEAMLAINVIVSSAVVFPAYALARLQLPRRASLLCAAVVAALPFHLMFPRSLLSENLYFPLLLAAVCLVLVEVRSRRLALDVVTGMTLGALYLTRHISLVIIPPLLLAWWLKPLDDTGEQQHFSARKFVHLGAVLAAMFMTYAPWVLLNRMAGNGVSSVLGFGIAARTNPAQLTLTRLSLIAACYLAYFVLLAAPVAGLVLASPFAALRRGLTSAYGRLTVAVWGSAAGVFVAVARHSWRAFYNYPTFSKIMGRYPLHFTGLFVILAFATALGPLAEGSALRRGRLFGLTVAMAGVSAVVAVWLSWRLIVARSLVPLSATMSDRGAVDGFRLLLLGEPSLWVAIALITVFTVLLLSRRTRALEWVLALTLIGYFSWGSDRYLARLRERSAEALLARRTAELVRRRYPDGVTVTLGGELARESADVIRFKRGIAFWGPSAEVAGKRSVAVGDAAPSSAVLVSAVRDKDASAPDGRVWSYEYRGVTYIFSEDPR